MELVLLVIIVALVFEYINGFHDTANSIATVVSTKVLTPRQAVILAASTNLVGALLGTAVAKTISSGLVDAKLVTVSSELLVCALAGGIIWNLITWWFGLPSSSSHALIGGLCGAALAGAHNNWSAIIWSQPNATYWWKGGGLLWKVVMPMFSSPIGGFILGMIIMGALYALITLLNLSPRIVNMTFGKAQILSAGAMGLMHGTNDAQKTMGIIALALMSATTAGTFDRLPSYMGFLYCPEQTASIQAARDIVVDMRKAGRGAVGNSAVVGKDFALADKSKNLVLASRKVKGLPEDPQAATQWLQTKAQNNNADAQVALGVLLVKAGNATEAVKWFSQAAERQHPDATFNLGLCNLQGIGFPQNDELALRWFAQTAEAGGIKLWIKVLCALVMAAGTAAGGWRIIKTLGHRMVKLQPVNGFAAETSSAVVIYLATMLGIPVSTTHNISAAIMGVGAARRLNSIKWSVVERMLWAWFLTIPVAAGLAYGFVKVMQWLSWIK